MTADVFTTISESYTRLPQLFVVFNYKGYSQRKNTIKKNSNILQKHEY